MIVFDVLAVPIGMIIYAIDYNNENIQKLIKSFDTDWVNRNSNGYEQNWGPIDDYVNEYQTVAQNLEDADAPRAKIYNSDTIARLKNAGGVYDGIYTSWWEKYKNKLETYGCQAMLVPWNVIDSPATERGEKKIKWRELDNDMWDIDSKGNLSFELEGEENMYDSDIMTDCYYQPPPENTTINSNYVIN